MTRAADPATTPHHDIDPNGVDRAQIRAMLALTPVERVCRLEQLIESVTIVRELNARRSAR